MTKAEWEACDDPHEMVGWVESKSSRKLRLLACACCRRIWNDIRDERCRAAVDGAEQFADDLIPVEVFTRLSEAADVAYGEGFNSPNNDPRIVGMYAATFTATREIAGWHLSDIFRAAADVPSSARYEEEVQADLIRDIFGNPFRPVAFLPAWRTDTAMSLARQMYESREFGAMPILADALQDAGCDSDALLNHLRDTGAAHVRGCWALDLVLGKG
jgi:hypothetical protein